jgi:hypothetical protein
MAEQGAGEQHQALAHLLERKQELERDDLNR